MAPCTRRNRIQQLDRLRAQRARRRQKIVVPFQIKALPAALEERIETPVVVLRRRADKALVEQLHRFVADRLPIVAQLCEFRKAVDRDHRLVRNRRARIHQHVVRGEIGRMIAELAGDPQTLAAAEMHIDRGCGEKIEDNKLWCEKRTSAFPYSINFAAPTTPCNPMMGCEGWSECAPAQRQLQIFQDISGCFTILQWRGINFRSVASGPLRQLSRQIHPGLAIRAPPAHATSTRRPEIRRHAEPLRPASPEGP